MYDFNHVGAEEKRTIVKMASIELGTQERTF